jgi:hypothetical protein
LFNSFFFIKKKQMGEFWKLLIYFFPSVNLSTFANVLMGGGGIAKFLISQNLKENRINLYFIIYIYIYIILLY